MVIPGAAFAVAVGVIGFDLFRYLDLTLIFDAILVGIFSIPFFVIGVVFAGDDIGWITAALASTTAAASTIVVPWLVDRSIENDPSSTAGLIHMWDQVLIMIPVGVVLGLGTFTRRRTKRTASPTVP